MELSTINAVGVWFYNSKTNRYLYLLRNDPKHPGSWGLPGGKLDEHESLLDGILRECHEELGFVPSYTKLVPVEKFTSADKKFSYHTFFAIVAEEFVPVLNDEHIGWAWIESGHWPKPLHPGLWSTINFETVKEKIKLLEQAV